MAIASRAKARSDVVKLLRSVPAGRVATFEMIAAALGAPPRTIAHLIDTLSEDEREMTPWYRVVAQGGAIGRGPHREAQFARLVREGLVLSPAGIVQDMARVTLTSFGDLDVRRAEAGTAEEPPRPVPASRSRGMKDRPR